MKKDLSDISLEGPSHAADLERPDNTTLEKVRYLVLVFSHAVSAIKIYPSNHVTVRKFQEELVNIFFKYFEDHDDLEIVVEEDSFSFGGETVYQEEKIPRSLPFLFFKDGMRKLIFLRGIGEEDVAEFMQIVRENALMSTSQSDIVDALWERDFEFIRYSAPDEFLETKIAAKEDVFQDLRVDKESLRTGKIELTDEDREDISGKGYALGVKEGQENPELDNLVTSLVGEKDESLESLLLAERSHSAEEEFLDLLFELLFLEDRIGHFLKILSFIEKHHLTLVRGRDFRHAVLLLDRLKELSDMLADSSPERIKSLDDFSVTATESVPLDCLEEARKILDPRDLAVFFEYLKRLGPRTLRLGVDIFETNPDPDIRSQAFDFLRDVGEKDMALLANMATERSPDLTKAIISILGATGDKKAVSLLASFLSYRSAAIKVEAIRALTNFSDELAAKIKIEFFHDTDERVRTAAASSLDPRRDRRALDVLLAAAADTKRLHRKSRTEKEAVLMGLGASRSPEAVEALRTILAKRGLLVRSRLEQTRLAAVAALRIMRVAPAMEVLKKGAKSRGRRVREACRLALADNSLEETAT